MKNNMKGYKIDFSSVKRFCHLLINSDRSILKKYFRIPT